MITDDLILFCGGPSIYGGAPKPLQRLRTGHTLIEHYLTHTQAHAPRNITLIVDRSFETAYSSLVNRLNYPSKIKILACDDGSSTFSKLKTYLNTSISEKSIVTFSYPDIFIIGKIDIPNDSDERFEESVFISSTPILSRFPRLVIDPYAHTVRGISNHVSPMPANPLHIYGGHLVVRVSLIKRLISDFLDESMSTEPSLEFDMFYWLTNTARLFSIPIDGRWIQADSPRDIEAILSLT